MRYKWGLKGITIFNHAFLYTAFADDSTFFLNDLLSVKNLVDTFKVFSLFSVNVKLLD